MNYTLLSSIFKFAICFQFLSFFQTSAQDPNFHIYLCFGQSNMAGAGDIQAQDLTVNSRFQFMKPQDCASKGQLAGNWYTAVPPLWGCTGGLGPADYFGRTLVENLPNNVKVGVIVVGIPGCKIELFGKTGYQGLDTYNNVPSKYAGSAYAWMLDLAKKAQSAGVIKGILLHQGESNSGDQNWPSKVKGVYDNLMTDLNLNPAQTPLLAGELLYQNFGSCCSGHNAVISRLPSVLPNSYVISASGLPGKDVYHFNSAGVRTFGQRYAEKMLTLYPKVTSPTVSITAPLNNAVYTAPASITLTATASDADGTISNVQFYNGTTLLGSDATAPYSYVWNNVAAGTYSITARATDNTTATTTSTVVNITVNVPQGPYNNQVHAIPGIIQIENYDLGGNGVAYNDASTGNTGGATFRTTEDVDLETCTDAGGGYNLGFATAGEWIEYTVNVATTGNYKLDLRVACNGDGRTVSFSMDGNNIANNIAIPNTAGWQTWTTTTVNNVSLTAGKHILRMTVGVIDYLNVNYLTFGSVITGINNEKMLNNTTVYPNPFESNFRLNNEGVYSYKLYDTLGRLLLQGNAEGESVMGSALQSGLYFLDIQSKSGTQLLKIQKK